MLLLKKSLVYSPLKAYGYSQLHRIWVISSMLFDLSRENICLIFICSFRLFPFYALEITYVKVFKKLLTKYYQF